MKNFLLAILCLFIFYGCKKDQQTKKIQVDVKIDAGTTYNLHIQDHLNFIDSENANTNDSFTINAIGGSEVPIVYYFHTPQKQYGQGTITFTYNSTVLLTINGGEGTQTLRVP